MYVKYIKKKDGKVRSENLVSGRKSKYCSNETIVDRKIWSVALYIRLSQEDEDNRKRKTRKQ